MLDKLPSLEIMQIHHYSLNFMYDFPQDFTINLKLFVTAFCSFIFNKLLSPIVMSSHTVWVWGPKGIICLFVLILNPISFLILLQIDERPKKAGIQTDCIKKVLRSIGRNTQSDFCNICPFIGSLHITTSGQKMARCKS